MAGKSKDVLQSIGEEIKSNPPSVLASTRAKYGPMRAEKQRVAMLLSKARKARASVPKPLSGGIKY
jgi:hypothetical protein